MEGVRRKKGIVIITSSFNCEDDSTSTMIYDYIGNSIRAGPEMNVVKFKHASVTLPTGDIAVFGGYKRQPDSGSFTSCEVFNVESDSFSKVGDTIEQRNAVAAVLLPTGGVVFVVGGGSTSCEFFNPSDRTFSPSNAKLVDARVGPTASLLPDGRVLVCGGFDGFRFLQTTEIYNQETDSFSAGPLMTVKRCGHAATVLEDGSVLVTGGEGGWYSTSTELYNPRTNSFSKGPRMAVERRNHFSLLLPNGTVLFFGGDESNQTTEIYDPETNSFSCSSTYDFKK
jgi:hypothetical protein